MCHVKNNAFCKVFALCFRSDRLLKIQEIPASSYPQLFEFVSEYVSTLFCSYMQPLHYFTPRYKRETVNRTIHPPLMFQMKSDSVICLFHQFIDDALFSVN